MSRTTITKAIDELNNENNIDGNIRQSGGGRKFVESNYPGIEEKIRKIIDGKTYGNPMRELSYTIESLRKIQTELEEDSIFVGHVTIGKILDAMGYGKQINQKTPQAGKPRPDRNAQFEWPAKVASAIISDLFYHFFVSSIIIFKLSLYGITDLAIVIQGTSGN
jgi:hypothetical protein